MGEEMDVTYEVLYKQGNGENCSCHFRDFPREKSFKTLEKALSFIAKKLAVRAKPTQKEIRDAGHQVTDFELYHVEWNWVTEVESRQKIDFASLPEYRELKEKADTQQKKRVYETRLEELQKKVASAEWDKKYAEKRLKEFLERKAHDSTG